MKFQNRAEGWKSLPKYETLVMEKENNSKNKDYAGAILLCARGTSWSEIIENESGA